MVDHRYVGSQKLSEMLQQPYDLYKAGWADAYLILEVWARSKELLLELKRALSVRFPCIFSLLLENQIGRVFLLLLVFLKHLRTIFGYCL